MFQLIQIQSSQLTMIENANKVLSRNKMLGADSKKKCEEVWFDFVRFLFRVTRKVVSNEI